MMNAVLLGKHIDKDLWQDVLARLDINLLADQILVIWDWRFLDQEHVHQVFPWTDWHSICEQYQDKRIILIIDSMCEAPHYGRHLSPLVDALLDQGRLSAHDIINLNGGQELAPVIPTLNCLGAFRKFSRDLEPAKDVEHHFIMLARVPKMLRVLAAVAVLDRGLDSFGFMSCGTREEDTTDTEWCDIWVPDHLKSHFPMLLDGHVRDFDTAQFHVSDDRIRNAAINVICETSQDDFIYANAPPNTVWSDRFITEKSAKAFRLLQIPIWISVPGTVQSIRDLGFDVFDDVVDHGYDLEPDPRLRVSHAIDQLERFCTHDITMVRDLRASLMLRLASNKMLADTLVLDFQSDLASLLNGYLRDRFNR